MKIIPAIDIINGKCVRLTQGDFGKMQIYQENPLDVALRFQEANLEYLHLVDLEGAKKGKIINWKIIETLQEKTALLIDFGGGVKTDEDVERLLELDINQINVGSMAVKEPEKFIGWLKTYGADNFILSADVKDEIVMISGWMKSAEERIYTLIEKYVDHGLKYLTCTDISVDGMLSGPNIQLYQTLKEKFPTLKINASGGISSLEDLMKLKSLNMDGAIIGKALYENRIELNDLKNFTK
jgi:phosphoribosylformimino-5-aminoimidazole carboxamide ribotide isomerase